MVSRTVSLEQSAYERLRLAKREGESFTDTVNRLLVESRPSFSRLAGILSKKDASSVREGIRRMRSLEREPETARYAQLRKLGHGRNA